MPQLAVRLHPTSGYKLLRLREGAKVEAGLRELLPKALEGANLVPVENFNFASSFAVSNAVEQTADCDDRAKVVLSITRNPSYSARTNILSGGFWLVGSMVELEFNLNVDISFDLLFCCLN